MGLALTQRLVEQKEGQIRVESGHGSTTFTVVISNRVVRERVQKPV